LREKVFLFFTGKEANGPEAVIDESSVESIQQKNTPIHLSVFHSFYSDSLLCFPASSSIFFVFNSSRFETFIIKRNVNKAAIKKMAIVMLAGIYSDLSSGKYRNKFNT